MKTGNESTIIELFSFELLVFVAKFSKRTNKEVIFSSWYRMKELFHVLHLFIEKTKGSYLKKNEIKQENV